EPGRIASHGVGGGGDPLHHHLAHLLLDRALRVGDVPGETWWSRWVRPVTCRPAMPENRAWWNRPTRGSVLACRPPSRLSPACRLIEATVVNTHTFASPVWNRSRCASTSKRSRP